MKKIFTLVFVLAGIMAVAQDYQLFNVNSKKVFRTANIYAESYCLTFDSSAVTSIGTIFYPYKMIADWPIMESECIVWNGECYERNIPTWFGESILREPDEDYLFLNDRGDTLIFDFTLAPIQSHIFYEDSVQRFSISPAAIPMDTMHFGNIVDTVRKFNISHTDLQGNFINSPLNNFEIVIGNQLGLVNFFSIKDFPMVLTPLYLMGNNNPAFGIYQLTNEMVFDHQPGDEFQYFLYYYAWPPTPFDFRVYSKRTCLERNETADSLTYLFKVESFEIDTNILTYDTISVGYLKNGIIARIPFDFLNDSMYYQTILSEQQIIDENLWTYSEYRHPAYTLCPEDGFWCFWDTDYFEEVNYTIGLGETQYMWESVHLYPYMGSEIVYYKKDGISHGQEMIVGVRDQLISDELVVIPNPAHDRFRISGSFNGNINLNIFDTRGVILKTFTGYKAGEEVNIEGMKPGVYIITLVDTMNTYSSKLVVQ